MKQMGWSYTDLMEVPYEEYLDHRRILSIEGKEEQKEQKKAERQAKRGA